MRVRRRTAPTGSQGRAVLSQSGRLGIAVRVIPRHALLAGPYDTGLIRWSEAAGAT